MVFKERPENDVAGRDEERSQKNSEGAARADKVFQEKSPQVASF